MKADATALPMADGTFGTTDTLRQIMIDAGLSSTRIVRRFARGMVALPAGRRP